VSIVVTRASKGDRPDQHGNSVWFVDGTDGEQEFKGAYLATKSEKPIEPGPLPDYNLTKSERGYRLRRQQQQQGGGGVFRPTHPDDAMRMSRAKALEIAAANSPPEATSRDWQIVARTLVPFIFEGKVSDQ
jgi:hypothetical protein